MRGRSIAMPQLARSRQGSSRVVSATIDEPGLLGIVERLFEGQTRKAHIAADAFSAPPGVRAAGAEAIELGDERPPRGRARPSDMLAILAWHSACRQPLGGL